MKEKIRYHIYKTINCHGQIKYAYDKYDTTEISIQPMIGERYLGKRGYIGSRNFDSLDDLINFFKIHKDKRIKIKNKPLFKEYVDIVDINKPWEKIKCKKLNIIGYLKVRLKI